ncbi:MAG: hotdog fold domain-containing protein [Candidatus Izemoplasmatales bacterium]|nr:hotdog fold domain-containing protein [Hujiaoplasma nucleasis]
MKTTLKLRMSSHDAHYGGNLVDGARILALFGDAATELLVRNDGDEGLFRAYEKVDFLAPVYAGDFLEVEAVILSQGNTSRKMEFKCYKIISPRTDISESACDVLKERILTTYALGTCIVPKEKQRNG